MGANSHAFLPDTTYDEFYSTINELFLDVNEYSPSEFNNLRNISIIYNGERKSISLWEIIIDVEKYNEINDYLKDKDYTAYTKDLQKYSDSLNHVSDGLPDKSWGIFISLGVSDTCIEICQILATIFDGYVSENDSQDENFYRMRQSEPKMKMIVERVFEEKA